jgi:hypothetical protein
MGREALSRVRILGFALTAPVMLRAPLPVLRWWLRPRRRAAAPDPAGVVSRVDAALALAGPVVRRTGLVRGLTLCRFLAEAGHEIELCFGVVAIGDLYHGRCWLERRGEPFLEAGDPRTTFVEVWRLSIPAA